MKLNQITIKWLRSAVEHVVTVFVLAVLGAYASSGLNILDLTKISALQRLGFAGVLAVGALVKSFIAKKTGNPATASFVD